MTSVQLQSRAVLRIVNDEKIFSENMSKMSMSSSNLIMNNHCIDGRDYVGRTKSAAISTAAAAARFFLDLETTDPL